MTLNFKVEAESGFDHACDEECKSRNNGCRVPLNDPNFKVCSTQVRNRTKIEARLLQLGEESKFNEKQIANTSVEELKKFTQTELNVANLTQNQGNISRGIGNCLGVAQYVILFLYQLLFISTQKHRKVYKNLVQL